MEKLKININLNKIAPTKLDIPNLENEQWKLFTSINNNFYYISNYGRVKADTSKGVRIMKTQVANNYERVHIIDKMFFIHRMVAEKFIDNVDKNIYIEVNHKDGNTLNNKSENLEWVTSKENSQAKENIKVYKLDLKGNILEEFNSTTDAAKSVNGDRGAIAKCCRNNYSKSNIYKGYLWKFSKEIMNYNYSNKPKQVAKIDPNTDEIIETYNNLNEAASSIGVGKTCIHNAIKGYSKYAGGFKWCYI